MEGFEPLEGQESKEKRSRNEKEKQKCNRIPNDLSPPQNNRLWRGSSPDILCGIQGNQWERVLIHKCFLHAQNTACQTWPKQAWWSKLLHSTLLLNDNTYTGVGVIQPIQVETPLTKFLLENYILGPSWLCQATMKSMVQGTWVWTHGCLDVLNNQCKFQKRPWKFDWKTKLSIRSQSDTWLAGLDVTHMTFEECWTNYSRFQVSPLEIELTRVISFLPYSVAS